MQMVETKAERYDARTIAFHWATLGLLAVQWGIAQIIDDFPRGMPRTNVRSVHIVLGVLILGVVLARVAWRASGGRRLPPADKGALHAVAKATHWGLYALLLAVLALGLFTAWARGDSIFGLFSIPAFDPANKDLREQAGDWHGTAVNLLLILAGIHAAAALVHQYVWRDRLIRRMMPGR